MRTALCITDMTDLRKLTLKEEAGLAIFSIVFFGLLAFSVYGFTFDDFIYTNRGNTFCFSGFNRVMFFSSLLILSLTFSLMAVFGYLLKFKIVEKRKPGSMNDNVILVPLASSFIGLTITSLFASYACFSG